MSDESCRDPLNLEERRPGIRKIIDDLAKEHPHWSQLLLEAQAKEVWTVRKQRGDL